MSPGARRHFLIAQEVQRMKIRIDEDEYHINDYHFIQLFRNVNAGNIGKSTELHMVLLNDFHDWNGLAAAASRSKVADFKHKNLGWMKKNKEIFPVDGGDMVPLSGADILTLALYLNDDVMIPQETRTKHFAQALAALELLKKKTATTVLAIQWPLRLPSGVRYKKGKTGEHHSEHFVWGPNGDAEHPHVHCFVDPEGDLYEAQATLAPLRGSENKRHLKFRNNLTVNRMDAMGAEDPVLDELEKVMKSVAYGMNLDVATASTKKEPAKETEKDKSKVVDEVDAEFVRYAVANDVDVDWVVAVATECGIAADEIDEWLVESLQTMAQSGGDKKKPVTVPEKKEKKPNK
jgi:hypothetical protein